MQLDALNAALRGGQAAPAPEAKAAAPQAPAANVAPPPTRAAVEAAVTQLNQILRAANNSVQFQIDDSTGKTVVSVVDEDTNEVVIQFPSEEVLAIARQLPAPGSLLKDSV